MSESSFVDSITPALERLAQQLPQDCTIAAQVAATRAGASLRQSLPRAKKVLPSDTLPGFVPAPTFVSVQRTSEGADIKIGAFYGSLTASLRSALIAAGSGSKIERIQLEVHKKAKGGAKGAKMVVSFESSERLRKWASEHYQLDSRSVIVSSLSEVAPWVGPAVDKARIEIFRDVSLSIQRASEGP